MIDAFKSIVGNDHVIDDREKMQPYLTDWRGRFHGSATAIVYPNSTLQIQNIVQICRDKKIAITPQGGNTGLVGAATPSASQKSIILNIARMNQLHPVDRNNQSVLVECGAVAKEVFNHADRSNLLFPLNLTPLDKVQIGGALATNAGGLNVLRYGMMRHLTLGVEAVLGNGEIYTHLQPLRKNNFGYAFHETLIGSEGTLGIFTRAQIRLFPKPIASVVLWIGFDDFESTLAFFHSAQSLCPYNISAFEYMNRESLRVVSEFPPKQMEPHKLKFSHYVLLQADSSDIGSLRTDMQRLVKTLPDESNFIIAGTTETADKIWHLRKSIAIAERAQGLSIKHDLSLPLSHWKDFMKQANKNLLQHWPEIQIIALGHLGDGNLHYNVAPVGLNAENYQEFADAINPVIFDLVLSKNGSPCAEHGVGLLRRAELKRYSDSSKIAIWQQIKRACDPDGIMNPDKVI